ncbi:carboxymethylenebutenolidase [Sphingomonas vulcanisoli]|uniref:Carboxymethylenebutenolidase n=1 Tax=Sphingomonas vulcanisoli TaxID=1658060 RepID=A0ABX0TXY9_9SPHN|nr:dienelactone hydrolase family protein [Sphingomonas vulcanisoli]NIJ09255.1 carboxymethylenebutenolidase [Sphingomonas vulcanisoli]
MREDISIRTGYGDCRSFIFTPDGSGPWPAIILFMDGGGIRPILFAMAERLAGYGYVVLLPDMFYRAGVYLPFDVPHLFATGTVRDVIGPYSATIDNALAAEDTAFFLQYLDTREDVAGPNIGTVGYCGGGAWSLTAAGRYPSRVVASASFHGTNLATESPMSPHWLAPYMKGEIYVAGAAEDKGYPPEMAARLEQALSAAGIDHRCEIYEGTRHAWTMPDVPAYDPIAAERHWHELSLLMKRKLS